MALDITSTAEVVKSNLEALDGLFFRVGIERVTTPPGEGPTAVIHPESMRVVETTLTHTIEQHVLKVRVYRARHVQDDDDQALEPSVITGRVMSMLAGDFQLGGGIRNVDVGGQYGQALEAEFVDEDIQQTPFHVADITVPLIVDGDTDFTA